MRIYLSGPMTGIPNKNALAFMYAEGFCETRGWTVENPIRLDEDLDRRHKSIGKPPPTYHQYIKRDIQLLTWCDAIVMLRGWQWSHGACLERQVGMEIGLTVYYQLEDVPWVFK